MIKTYYNLTKPRMVFMNVLVAGAAFVFASPEIFDWQGFGVMIAGLSFVVASACVFNNYADRHLDAHMERTKSRAIPGGKIKPTHALVFGFVLMLCGVALLLTLHPLALWSALLGFVTYVFVYTPLKPKTGLALYVGAVAGATPPLVGYAAAAHMLDLYALGLFLFMFFWQIPHFLAIARYRFDEYGAAGVPLLVKKPQSEQERSRARKIFHYSLVVLLLFCLILILQRWIK
jgi:protoheme IX farnesyltransferase